MSVKSPAPHLPQAVLAGLLLAVAGCTSTSTHYSVAEAPSAPPPIPTLIEVHVFVPPSPPPLPPALPLAPLPVPPPPGAPTPEDAAELRTRQRKFIIDTIDRLTQLGLTVSQVTVDLQSPAGFLLHFKEGALVLAADLTHKDNALVLESCRDHIVNLATDAGRRGLNVKQIEYPTSGPLSYAGGVLRVPRLAGAP